MTLSFYAPTVTHTVETLLTLWVLGGYGEATLILDSEAGEQSQEHFHARQRLEKIAGISLSRQAAEADVVMSLIRRGGRKLPKTPGSPWLVSELETRNPRYWLKEWRQSGAQAFRSKGVLCMAPRGRCPAWFFKRTLHYPNYVHPQLLANDGIGLGFQRMLRENREKNLECNFFGSKQPQSRARILSEIRDMLKAEGISADAMDFHAYDTEEERKARPPLEPLDYLDILARSHFTLCPNGWDNYSHRVVEAAACGSIPILPEPAHRYAGLEPGINCLEVRANRWVERVREAVRMSAPQRASMRQNLQSLRENVLPPEKFARLIWEPMLRES